MSKLASEPHLVQVHYVAVARQLQPRTDNNTIIEHIKSRRLALQCYVTTETSPLYNTPICLLH